MNPPRAPAILLLEDQSIVRQGMRLMVQLAEPASKIVEASTYQEAIKHLTQERFDIAFLDIDLSDGHSGIEVLRYLKTAEIETRPIMLSGHEEADVVMECLREGASGYIFKNADGDGEDIFRRSLATIFAGGVFLPSSVLGRGGFSPASQVPNASKAPSLSPRLQQVLYYLCQGLANKQIARHLDLSEATVRQDYVPKLFRVFGVATRAALLVEVSRRGLVITLPSDQAAEHSASGPP